MAPIGLFYTVSWNAFPRTGALTAVGVLCRKQVWVVIYRVRWRSERRANMLHCIWLGQEYIAWSSVWGDVTPNAGILTSGSHTKGSKLWLSCDKVTDCFAYISLWLGTLTSLFILTINLCLTLHYWSSWWPHPSEWHVCTLSFSWWFIITRNIWNL